MTKEIGLKQLQNKKTTNYLRFIVASFLLIFLIISVGLNELLLAIKNIHPLPLIGVAICVLCLIMIGAINIWILLNTLSAVPFINLLKVYSYSWAMSLITPGQVGDATIILLMKKHQIPFSSTGSAYLIDKVITLCLFLIISGYGCSYLLPNHKIEYLALLQTTSILAIVATAIYFLIPAKLRLLDRLRKFIRDIRRNLAILRNNSPIVLANLFFTIFKWIVVSWSFRLAFLSFGLNIKWPDIAVIPIMSTLVGYIPISIGGIGTVELSATYLFGLREVPAHTVVTAYLLMRLINYITALVIITLMTPFKAR